MNPVKIGLKSLAVFLIIPVVILAPTPYERIISAAGWNVPEPTKMIPDKAEKITLSGIPIEITAESWKTLGMNHDYDIENKEHLIGKPVDPNAFYKERVEYLTLYKTPEGRILCYRYVRLLVGPHPQLVGPAVFSFICDLDDDGSNESQFYVGDSDEAEVTLLTSILRIKLGLSGDAELMRRLIRSIVSDLKARAKQDR
jgi:hypothetical protein